MNRQDVILFYEKYAIEKVLLFKKNLTKKVNHLTATHPQSIYDFEIDGKKYDVKFANPSLSSRHKKINTWTFDLRKREKRIAGIKECDFYVLIGLLQGSPRKVFLISSKLVPTSNIRISIRGKSKYHKFEI